MDKYEIEWHDDIAIVQVWENEYTDAFIEIPMWAARAIVAAEREKVREWHPKCETCRHWDNKVHRVTYALCGLHGTAYLATDYCSSHTALLNPPQEGEK